MSVFKDLKRRAIQCGQVSCNRIEKNVNSCSQNFLKYDLKSVSSLHAGYRIQCSVLFGFKSFPRSFLLPGIRNLLTWPKGRYYVISRDEAHKLHRNLCYVTLPFINCNDATVHASRGSNA